MARSTADIAFVVVHKVSRWCWNWEGNVETYSCYSVGMEYAVVSEVGDELCVAEAAASPGHVDDSWR